VTPARHHIPRSAFRLSLWHVLLFPPPSLRPKDKVNFFRRVSVPFMFSAVSLISEIPANRVTPPASFLLSPQHPGFFPLTNNTPPTPLKQKGPPSLVLTPFSSPCISFFFFFFHCFFLFPSVCRMCFFLLFQVCFGRKPIRPGAARKISFFFAFSRRND